MYIRVRGRLREILLLTAVIQEASAQACTYTSQYQGACQCPATYTAAKICRYTACTKGCLACQSGYYCPGVMRPADKAAWCDPGLGYYDIPSATCLATAKYECPLGSWSAFQSSQCTLCVAGKYSAVYQATSEAYCNYCAAGTYSSTAGSSACTSCPVNTFSTGGAGSCTACNHGFSTVGLTGQTSCTNDVGYYYPGGTRTRCPAESYCPDGINKRDCPQYTYGIQQGQGTSANCAQCVTACGPGSMVSTSTAGACGYSSGAVAGSPATACEPCPAGRYCLQPTNEYLGRMRAFKLSLNLTAPESLVGDCSCPMFSVAADGGITRRLFMNMSGGGCNPFQASQTSPPDCRVCPAGHACSSTDQQPVPCSAGTYAAQNQSSCIPCDTSPCPAGQRRSPKQCNLPLLWDSDATRQFDRCLQCPNCFPGNNSVTSTSVASIHAMCVSNCDLKCRPGFYMSYNSSGYLVLVPPG